MLVFTRREVFSSLLLLTSILTGPGQGDSLYNFHWRNSQQVLSSLLPNERNAFANGLPELEKA